MSDQQPPPSTYIAPRRVVALCYQPSDCNAFSSLSVGLSGACSKLAVVGSAGGLVVSASPAATELPPAVSYLSAVLGLPLSAFSPFSPEAAPEPTADACSPAAVYPPRYGRLRVQLLTCSALAERHVQLLISKQNNREAAQHLLSPRLIPNHALQSSTDVATYITEILQNKQSEANALIVHVSSDVLPPGQSAADNSLLPPLLDDALASLLQLVGGAAADRADAGLSDVYLTAIRLQPLLHTSPLASSPLAAFVPKQSYQLSVPSASPTSAFYLPLLSFHHNTTRSDRCLHSARPERFAVGSGGLIAATDWLAELAFRLGGKAKYGA